MNDAASAQKECPRQRRGSGWEEQNRIVSPHRGAIDLTTRQINESDKWILNEVKMSNYPCIFFRGDGTVIEEDAAQDVYRKGASIVDKWINGSDYEKSEKNLEVINEAEFVKHDGSKVSGKDVLADKKAGKLLSHYASLSNRYDLTQKP